MYFVERTAVVVKPTQVFLDFLKQADKDDVLPDLALSQLRANCSVFLVPIFDEPEAVVAYFAERYVDIFKNELATWSIEEQDFPKTMDFNTFLEFFELEIHDTVLDLEESDLQVSPVLDTMR